MKKRPVDGIVRVIRYGETQPTFSRSDLQYGRRLHHVEESPETPETTHIESTLAPVPPTTPTPQPKHPVLAPRNVLVGSLIPALILVGVAGYFYFTTPEPIIGVPTSIGLRERADGDSTKLADAFTDADRNTFCV